MEGTSRVSRRRNVRSRTGTVEKIIPSLHTHQRPEPLNWHPSADALYVPHRNAPSREPFGPRLVGYKNRGPHHTICEKRVIKEDIAGLRIVDYFREIGQEGLLQLHSGEGPGCYIYENACVEFIGGIHTLTQHSLISTMRGREVEITLTDLRERFRIDTLNQPYTCAYLSLSRKKNGAIFARMVSDIAWYSEEYATICFCGEKRLNFPKRMLTHIPRIVSKIMAYNMLPRTSETSMVRDDEVFFLHALYTGSPLYSMAWVILCYWMLALNKREKNTIPFAVVLSTVLRERGIIYAHETFADPRQYGIERLIGDGPIYPQARHCTIGEHAMLEGMEKVKLDGIGIKLTSHATQDMGAQDILIPVQDLEGAIQRESIYLPDLMMPLPPLLPIPLEERGGAPTPAMHEEEAHGDEMPEEGEAPYVGQHDLYMEQFAQVNQRMGQISLRQEENREMLQGYMHMTQQRFDGVDTTLAGLRQAIGRLGIRMEELIAMMRPSAPSQPVYRPQYDPRAQFYTRPFASRSESSYRPQFEPRSLFYSGASSSSTELADSDQ